MKSPILKNAPFFIWLLMVFTCLILIFLVLAAPVIYQRWPQLSAAIYSAYAPFCHQIRERCFLIANEPLAVCARCFGIMTGFSFALIIYPLIVKLTSPKPLGPAWLIGVSLPLAIDLAGNMLRFWSSPNWLRFVIGSSWGILLPFYFLPAIMSFWLQKAAEKQKLTKR